jgi:hypothetical protein
MKHKEHVVKVNIYNPDNLKEIIRYRNFTIKYIPTIKWNVYLILVNGLYCKIDVNLINLYGGGNSVSSRGLIAKSILNYICNETSKYQNRVKVFYPNIEILKMTEKIFSDKLLIIKEFKNRDEIFKLGLILN